MEVIADDVYFEPWNSDFNVKTSKKVNVVVSEQVEEKPKLKVQVFPQAKENPKPKIVETAVKKPLGVKMTKEELFKRMFKSK